MANIAIIGGGPAGMTAAYHLGLQGHDISVFEEHPIVGDPFQCTGILTGMLEDFVPLDPKFFMNKIQKARISIHGQPIDFNLQKPNVIVDRIQFDQWLGERAEKEGVKVFAQHRYLSNTGTTVHIKDVQQQKMKDIDFDYLIGADGPKSPVGTFNNMKATRSFWFGAQARVRLKNDNFIEFFPTIGTYAWMVPENEEIMRIGVAAEKDTQHIFKKLLADNNITKVENYQGGLIPRYDPRIESNRDNIFLLGDAATQVKATTGGGIIPGMQAAEVLAESIEKGSDYHTAWKKKIGRELWIHLMMRKMMDKFAVRDWDLLARLFQQEKTKELIEMHDRERPSSFLIKLFLREPRLAYFGRFIL